MLAFCALVFSVTTAAAAANHKVTHGSHAALPASPMAPVKDVESF
jgi:hypothetical protein